MKWPYPRKINIQYKQKESFNNLHCMQNTLNSKVVVKRYFAPVCIFNLILQTEQEGTF